MPVKNGDVIPYPSYIPIPNDDQPHTHGKIERESSLLSLSLSLAKLQFMTTNFFWLHLSPERLK